MIRRGSCHGETARSSSRAEEWLPVRADGATVDCCAECDRANWAKSVDLKTGRPAMNPESSNYGQGPKIVFPATPGARNWHPASFDPATGLYYAAVLDMGNLMFMTPGQKPYARRMLNVDAALIFGPDLEAALPALPPPVQAAVFRAATLRCDQRRSIQSRAIDPLTDRRAGPPKRLAGPRGSAHDRERTRVGRIDGSPACRRATPRGSSIDTARRSCRPMTYRVNGVQYVG